jgi:AcrR family transcriptional regulator
VPILKKQSDTEKKQRLSKEETSQILIKTAISMMATTPISELSSLKICATAGLDKMTVRYCFGSHIQLLTAVAHHLAADIAPHIQKGVIATSARSDQRIQLFGRLTAFMFASFGDQIPIHLAPTDQYSNIVKIHQQLQDTYGLRPDLAWLLTRRAILTAIANAGLGSMVPLSDAEAELFVTIQERTYEFLASIQDELQLRD